MAALYIVATPIGNLEDITLRAVRILREVDVIACEDTRHTLTLLNHLGIKKPLISCYAYEEEKGAARVCALLSEGKNVAYCSDAGTPGISDPGAVLAAAARKRGQSIVPVPGVSAYTALISVAEPFGRTVTFDGFLSPKPGRRLKRVTELMSRDEAFVLYESPHRIVKLLSDIASIDPDRQLCLGRELTKAHEEIICTNAAALRDDFAARASIKGEIAVFVAPPPRMRQETHDAS